MEYTRTAVSHLGQDLGDPRPAISGSDSVYKPLHFAGYLRIYDLREFIIHVPTPGVAPLGLRFGKRADRTSASEVIPSEQGGLPRSTRFAVSTFAADI